MADVKQCFKRKVSKSVRNYQENLPICSNIPPIVAAKGNDCRYVLLGVLVFRLCNIILVQTWFVPDEFWQGPEVAHHMVFDYGHLTWEWHKGIRGYIYPLLFSAGYKCLSILKMDSPFFIIYSPRVIQTIFGAFGEYYIYRLAKLLYGCHIASCVLFSELTSWFMFYCITRTLTNSMETALNSIGLYYWELSSQSSEDIKNRHSSLNKALIFASLSCLVRPTALVLWIPLGVMRLSQSSVMNLFFHVLPVALASLALSLFIDSYFYGRLILVQYNFLKFNVLQGIADIYGTHSWHWYLTQGLPVVLFIHLIPFSIAIYYCRRALQKWLLLIFIHVCVFSCLSHKEFRFILPILPMAMIICGHGFHYLLIHDSKKSKNYDVKGKFLVLFILVTNIPISLYTGLVHQRGTIDVMQALRENIQNKANSSIVFLMPCHSTPFHSHIHQEVEMRFLDCSPSLKPGYVDEADHFYIDPQRWLKEYFIRSKLRPTNFVLLDILLKDIQQILVKHSYSKCGEYFYTQFPNGRLGRSVLLFCRVEI